MLARSSLLTARSALRQAPANPAMRRGLHVDSESFPSPFRNRFIFLDLYYFRTRTDWLDLLFRCHQQHHSLRYAHTCLVSVVFSPLSLMRERTRFTLYRALADHS